MNDRLLIPASGGLSQAQSGISEERIRLLRPMCDPIHKSIGKRPMKNSKH
jgi:hypothetical protein